MYLCVFVLLSAFLKRPGFMILDFLTCQSPHLYLPSTGVNKPEPPHLVFIFIKILFLCICVRACLNIRAPRVRRSLELQLIVSRHIGAGIGCSFSSLS